MKSHIADVLIPAHNEATIIDRTLRSIILQDIPENWRFTVHVLANGCTDETVKVAKQTVEQLQPHPQFRFMVHKLPIASKIKALNHGLTHARAPFVLCVDADAVLSANCFAVTLGMFNDEQVMVAGPVPQFIISSRNCDRLLGQVQRTVNICNRWFACTAPSGCMTAFRRDLIKRYPETIAADDTWLSFYAAHKYGWESVRVTKQAKVKVVAPQHWVDYVKQESRFVRCTQQLLEVFPEFKPVLKAQHRYQQGLKAKFLEKVKEQLTKERVPFATLRHLQMLVRMYEENAELMAKQLLSSDGHWEAILTTKQTPDELC